MQLVMITEHCQKTSRYKSHCFQLEKCFKCEQVGHIATFCKAKEESQLATSHVETVCGKGVLHSVAINQEHDFLYNVGNQQSIMPRNVYDKLASKPPLSPVNVSGIGISGERFAIDGVAYLNIQLVATNGMAYTLEYEPVLVTAAVDTCIFGIKAEMPFRKSQDRMTFTFVTPESQNITIAYYREVETDNSLAYIEVAEGTAIDDRVSWIKQKVSSYVSIKNTEEEFMFAEDEAMATSDMSIPT